jgi:hypothetical protein
MEQPNITSHGAGVLTARFWVLVVLTGIAAGLLGALMMLILFNVQYAAFGRLLVARGGGGLAAVYNVPLAGALFTAEILIGSIALPVMLPALACSWIATATAWIYLPIAPPTPASPTTASARR